MQITADFKLAVRLLNEYLKKNEPPTASEIRQKHNILYAVANAIPVLFDIYKNRICDDDDGRREVVVSLIEMFKLEDEIDMSVVERVASAFTRRPREAIINAVKLDKFFHDAEDSKFATLKKEDRSAKKKKALELAREILSNPKKAVNLTAIAKRTGISKVEALSLYRDVAPLREEEQPSDEFTAFEYNGIQYPAPWCESEKTLDVIVEIPGFPKTAVIADLHLPFYDKEAYKIAIAAIKEADVDLIVIAGDMFDCYAMSQYEKEDGFDDFDAEVKASVQFVHAFERDVRTWKPSLRIIYMGGNHEQRITNNLNRNLRALRKLKCLHPSQLFELEAHNIECIPDGVNGIRIGDVHIAHGDSITGGRGSSIAQKAFSRWGHRTIIEGHHHKAAVFLADSTRESLAGGYCVACLSSRKVKYARANNYIHGFLILEFNKYGEPIIDNNVILHNRVSRII